MKNVHEFVLVAGLLASSNAIATTPVQEAMGRVSAERAKASVDTLASFGTRHTLSETESPTRGIGAARNWLKGEFEAIKTDANGLQVRFEEFAAPKMPRLPDGARIVNVVATLPGTSAAAKNRVVYVVGHYDTINADRMDPKRDAPGANDDASGTVVVLECARVLAAKPLETTVVFLCTAAEEQGLVGAKFHAEQLAASGAYSSVWVLNNDIVGDPSVPFILPNGSAADSSTFVRVFSEAIPRNVGAEGLSRLRTEGLENDSPSRQLARYVAEVAQREGMKFVPRLMHRQDRFLRGGDHSAFNESGFPAVRFSVPAEDYSRQHADVITKDGKPYGDTAEFVSGAYVADVARLNTAAILHLASAPGPTRRTRMLTKTLETTATLRWDAPADADVAGYEIVLRETSAPMWQHTIDVGMVTEKTLPVSKDNYFFAVRAYDLDGFRGVPEIARAVAE
ncbi:MAG: M28 family metallopeptidase [Planctomycetes bacterium]|nr:M28 family metallopeptidase [Planctomycetota bacterium]